MFVSWVRVFSLVSMAGAAILSFSQNSPNSQRVSDGPDLRVTADLVLVDVVVNDDGKPIHGLKKEQFHVFENGKEQTIASFEEHQTVTPAARNRIVLPAATFSNVPEYPETGVFNVLLLDGLNTIAANNMEVRRQMLDFLGAIKPGTRLAIFALGGSLRQLTGFTTDRTELMAALKQSQAVQSGPRFIDAESDKIQQQQMRQIDSPSIDDSNSTFRDMHASTEVMAYMRQFLADVKSDQMDRRVAMTLEALDELARYLSAIPGRKNLIWFSGSFPVALDPDLTLVNPFLSSRNYAGQVRQTAELLSAARVAVYPVDAHGLISLPLADAADPDNPVDYRVSVPGGRPEATVSGFGEEDKRFIQERMAKRGTMLQVAAATGGRTFVNTNGFDAAIANAIDDGSNYYTIAYVPSHRNFDGRFRKLQVKLEKAHGQLSYRSGYYADAPDKPSPHRPGETSLLMASALHGAPTSSQIQFQARVLASEDPLLKGEKLPETPAGEEAGRIKGPVQTYVIDLNVDPHGMAFEETPDGTRHARIELVLVAYEKDGRRANYVDKLYYLDMKPESFEKARKDGITARLALDVPAMPGSLRIVVYDPGAGRAGSLEIPFAGSKETKHS